MIRVIAGVPFYLKTERTEKNEGNERRRSQAPVEKDAEEIKNQGVIFQQGYCVE